ncbi:MAG: SCF ubiquitin ligase complex subunit [Trizodia sp. TS-e1964]|nr:MAG: SCF ubiquitin ligase complex subunit [Trizodia sp. TS-e1964]
MAGSRSPFRGDSVDPTSESSSASSPERAAYDDTDFSTYQANDSQSSIGVPTFRDMAVSEEEICRSPISRLPAELLIAIFAKLSAPMDLRSSMLVSKTWARNCVDLLWHRPSCNSWKNLMSVVHSLRKADAYFAYHDLVKRLNLSSLANEVSDGTVHPLAGCKRVERLTLTGCVKLTDSGVIALLNGNNHILALDISGLESITDNTLFTIANNCKRVQGLNITGCKLVTDASLTAVSENCRQIKRLKLNNCSQVGDDSIIAFAYHCPHMLEIDLQNCKNITDTSVTALITYASHLRELRLAHCSLITDEAFSRLNNYRSFDSLRILDLTACDDLTDKAVAKIVERAPRLRNLVLAKCRRITDVAVTAITKLGKNLHYVHLGHCSLITDKSVIQLVKSCNRIRYIDLGCCSKLTDVSVQQLATLPKLRRIGLVKCHQITDISVLALARSWATGAPMLPPSNIERVHLSYCGTCFRKEFTDHQRDVFCVFSGPGVTRLRAYLNQQAEQAGEEGSSLEDDDGTPAGVAILNGDDLEDIDEDFDGSDTGAEGPA